MKSSRPGPEMTFQSTKVYVSCQLTHFISLYDKLQLVCSSSLCKQVFAVHVFIKMDKLKYRAVIKFFIFEGLIRKKISPNLTKVYGKSALSILTIKEWGAEFKCGPR
jgi:hypothetical protein